MLVGTHYPFPSEPLIAEDTRRVDAGCITIGVEYRHPDVARVQAIHEGTAFEGLFREFREQLPPKAGSDQAVASVERPAALSLHVIDSESGHEYLRFDCFDNDPHYHYMHPWTNPEECDNHVVVWDLVAHGPMTPWALERLRTRLPEMLTEAGGAHLAARLDQALIDRAVDEVGKMVDEATTVTAQ